MNPIVGLLAGLFCGAVFLLGRWLGSKDGWNRCAAAKDADLDDERLRADMAEEYAEDAEQKLGESRAEADKYRTGLRTIRKQIDELLTSSTFEHAREVARKFAEDVKSGAVLALPNQRHEEEE